MFWNFLFLTLLRIDMNLASTSLVRNGSSVLLGEFLNSFRGKCWRSVGISKTCFQFFYFMWLSNTRSLGSELLFQNPLFVLSLCKHSLNDQFQVVIKVLPSFIAQSITQPVGDGWVSRGLVVGTCEQHSALCSEERGLHFIARFLACLKVVSTQTLKSNWSIGYWNTFDRKK